MDWADVSVGLLDFMQTTDVGMKWVVSWVRILMRTDGQCTKRNILHSPVHVACVTVCGVGILLRFVASLSASTDRLNSLISCLFLAGACHIIPGLMALLRQIRPALKDYCRERGRVFTPEYNGPKPLGTSQTRAERRPYDIEPTTSLAH